MQTLCPYTSMKEGYNMRIPNIQERTELGTLNEINRMKSDHNGLDV